jgi:hypothetical protein
VRLSHLRRIVASASAGLLVLSGLAGATANAATASADLHALSYDFAHLDTPIAGVAGGRDVVFVGEPLNGTVVALSRLTGRQLGTLPTPPDGFVLPFIVHSLGENRIGVLDAGGVPQPDPFVPANPTIYVYTYSYSPAGGFSAKLTRTIKFTGVPIGFSEDFAELPDGRMLISDAILGAIWVVRPDGTIAPGIVPKSYDPPELIPALAYCPTMPQVTVNGVPFLFSGSTLPGVSPLAVRDGTVYFYSPCARGTFSFPLSILSDGRLPYQRAADIKLVGATPADVPVEELLDFTFDPFDPSDRYLYAADALQLRVIRLDVKTGARQVVAADPRRFDFPSALGFLPTSGGLSELAVVSNQQERLTVTNDAISQDAPNLPFVVAKILLPR